MPALATLKELSDVYKKIRTLKKQHPKACKAMTTLLGENRRIGVLPARLRGFDAGLRGCVVSFFAGAGSNGLAGFSVDGAGVLF